MPFAQFPHLLVADATTDALTLTNGANTWQVSGAHLDAWALWTDHQHDLVRDFAALGLAYQQLQVPDLAQADYYFGTIVRQSEMEAYWVSRNSLLYDIGEYSAVPQKHAEIRFLVAEETNRQLTLLDIQSYFALESDSLVLQLTDNLENPRLYRGLVSRPQPLSQRRCRCGHAVVYNSTRPAGSGRNH
jgi:hypothetical protein